MTMQLGALLGIVKLAKKNSKGSLTKAYQHVNQQTTSGHVKTFVPLNDEHTPKPPESRKVQCKVHEIVNDIMADLVTTAQNVVNVDRTNQGTDGTRADLVINGKEIAKDVPATALIFLESQLEDVLTLIRALPTLSADKEWVWDQASGLYRATVVQTISTTKEPRPIVLYPATPEHPAQTQLHTQDVLIGHWHTQELSGAWPETQQKAAIKRVQDAIAAVIAAKAKANSVPIKELPVADALFKFVFNG